jgi:hypothetical protein
MSFRPSNNLVKTNRTNSKEILSIHGFQAGFNKYRNTGGEEKIV